MNRREESYKSEEDAKLIFKSANTKDITDDSTLQYFKDRINKNDHWNSSHMKIQLGYVLDCLVVIYS